MAAFQFKQRSLPRLGLFTMLVLLLFSMLFWRERAWLLDVAFQTFLMIKDGTVWVMVYRFGAATVQSLPLLAIKLGAPLAWVSWLYSVSFHLHFLLFFCIANYWFKREDVGLGIVLLYTAMTYDGFYWQTSELQQGLGFLLVTWAALLYSPTPQRRWWYWPAWAIAIIALAFYHPLVFMPFYFMLIWLWFRPKTGIPRWTLGILGSLMMLVLVIKQVWFQNWYDLQKTSQFKSQLIADFPNYFNYPAYGKFFTNALQYWWGYSLLFIIICYLLLRKRQYLGVSFLLITLLGFLALTAIGDHETPFRFYAEVNYYPLLAFVLVPIIIQGMPMLQKAPQYKFYLVATFFAARLLLIFLHGQEYTKRIDYIRQLTTTTKQEQQRLTVPNSQLDQIVLLMDWGLPYETLLQSATESNRPITLLPISSNDFKVAELEADSLFVTPWDEFPLDEVNANPYWHFPSEAYGKFIDN
ncbi:MAG: hypothetical protein AAFU03_00760 [Bacteroidota bacterium]